jgi:uridine kinase
MISRRIRKTIPYGSKIPVHLTTAERDLIREHTFYDTDFANLAVVEGDLVRIDMTLEDIEDLQGYVAAECNHCEDPKLEKKLDPIFDKLQDLLDQYEEEDEE